MTSMNVNGMSPSLLLLLLLLVLVVVLLEFLPYINVSSLDSDGLDTFLSEIESLAVYLSRHGTTS